MLVFHSPDIVNGSFELAIARRSPGTYLIILARAYGMAATRVYTVLNTSTPPSTVPPLSSSGHPLIWLDADLDRRPPHLGPPNGVLAALRAADSEVIRPTGRTQRMNDSHDSLKIVHLVVVTGIVRTISRRIELVHLFL